MDLLPWHLCFFSALQPAPSSLKAPYHRPAQPAINCPPPLFQAASLQAENQKAQAQVSKAKLVLATSKKATAAAESAAEEALARAAAAEAAAREACTAQAAVEQLEGRLREVEAELERAQGGPADGFVLGTLGHVPCTCGTRRTQPLSFRDRRGHKHNYGVAGTAWDVAVHVNAAPQTPRPCCNHACAGHTSICCSFAFDEPLRPCGSPLRRRGAAAGAGARRARCARCARGAGGLGPCCARRVAARRAAASRGGGGGSCAGRPLRRPGCAEVGVGLARGDDVRGAGEHGGRWGARGDP